MAVATGAGWRATLTGIEAAIAECLAALDRYEGVFAGVLADSTPAVTPAAPPTPGRWDAKLDAARESADAVERLLAEQEAVWGRWRDAIARLTRGEKLDRITG